jgi:hypothetical protein
MNDMSPDSTHQAADGATRPHADPDWMLATLVETVNAVGGDTLGISVTVMAGGGVLTGYLISEASYYRGYGALWSALTTDEAARDRSRAQYEALAQAADAAHAEMANATTAGTTAGTPPASAYVHLRDARLVTGTALMPNAQAGMLWRGRLADISGFALGALGAG